ncbi:MAG TPA: GNAT family N-acetyltransferase [Polyangiales bacterium]
MSDPQAIPELAVTERTQLRRHPERGHYDRALVHAIIDETLLCHVGFVADGAPCVLPTAHARLGDQLYLHGAQQNRMLRALLAGPAAITFTLLDGLVFARSAFRHSMNFRCVALFGQASEVLDPSEKRAALSALVDHMAPSRASEVRPPNQTELKATLVLRIPIVEASVKLRSGPAVDTQDDLTQPCWAGVLPLRLRATVSQPDPQLTAATQLSPAVSEQARRLGGYQSQAWQWRNDDYLVSTERARLDVELVHRFLSEQSYWAAGISRQRVERAIAHSVCFGLYRGTQQVGFARVATDFTRAAYLADVFVADGLRGRGLGRWLVECVLAHPELASVDRWLLGTRDAQAFYEPFGFRPADQSRWMVRTGPAQPAPG